MLGHMSVLPPPRDAHRPYRICIVCLGNICRSPMAEVILRDELAAAGLAGKVEVDSAGTGDWHLGEAMDPGAGEVLTDDFAPVDVYVADGPQWKKGDER